MGQIHYITIDESKPKEVYTVSVPLLRLARKLGQHYEDHQKIVDERDQWLRQSIGDVTFQADYHAQIVYYHFENPYTAVEFKFRWC